MGNARSEALYREIVESLRSAGLITLTQTSGSCNVHHKVIDDNWQTYPVEHLRKMKEDHEIRLDGKEQVDDRTSDAFAAAASIYFVQHGSVIHTTNQTGGQVAHSITNNFVFPATGQWGRVRALSDSRLSQRTVELLRDAADGDGTILVLHADAGLGILVNGKERSSSRSRVALDSSERHRASVPKSFHL
jgi:hypothetical protein